MQKTFFFSLILLSSFFACKKTKKIQPAKPQDTLHLGLFSAKDTLFLSKNPKNLDFKFFSSTAKVDFTDGTNDTKFKAIIRIQKDSITWLSMQAVNLGVEGLRILATRDSIKLLFPQEKSYQFFSYQELSEQYGFDFNYDLLQSILIGDMPIKKFDKEKVLNDTNFYIIRQKERFLEIDNYLDKQNLKLQKIEVKDRQTNSQMQMQYSDFVELDNKELFAEKNTVDLAYYNKKGFYKIKLEIDHKKTKLNSDTLKFPFKIPKKYQKK